MDKKGFIVLDSEIISSPAFWIITIITMVGLVMGLNFGSMIGLLGIGKDTTYSIPFYLKIVIVFLCPVIAYFIVGMMKR